MKCLRRLEDTDFPCDKSSDLDKEERISMEDLSNTRRFLKSLRSDESKTPRAGRIREPNEPSYRNYKERVEAMQNKVTGLRDKFNKVLQEAKVKLQQENPASSGSGTNHN